MLRDQLRNAIGAAEVARATGEAAGQELEGLRNQVGSESSQI